MVLKAYSIRDQKSETFGAPFYSKTHGEAERNFKQLVNDKQSTVCTYPDDFDLYHIGDYDDNSGKFSPLDTPNHMIKAVQLKESIQ